MQRVLLLIHGIVWGAVTLVVVLRTGAVPPELWAVLPAGITGILVAYRVGADDRPETRRKRSEKS